MSATARSSALFPLGRMFLTVGAEQTLVESRQSPAEFLRRHQAGDWGELSDEDKRENDLSLKEDFRILSAYRTRVGVKLWVITEHDRSVTTILLPSEY